MYLFFKSFIMFVLRNLIYFCSEQKKCLRIITLHDIDPKDFKKLYCKLYRLKKNWNFISPQQLINQKKLKGRNILLTFDDGFLSQKVFADKYLDKLEIKAIFFIITDFASIKNKKNSIEFIKKNIDKKFFTKKMHKYLKNMTWRDINSLIKKNHFIGSHTVSHQRLTECQTKKLLISEICESKKIIEKKINRKISFFAYPFGDFNSINKNILKTLKKNYHFIFSGLRGNNFYQKKNFYMRDAISPETNFQEILFYLNGFMDKFYKFKYLRLF